MPRWLPTTRRPQNVCRHCGYRWYPRGHNVASQCPRCGAVAPAVASGGCCGPLVGLGVVLLLCIFASAIVGSATQGLLPASPTAISFFALATDTRNPELVPATEPPAPVLPTATPDAAAVRQRQAEGARATMVAGVFGTQTALAPTARPSVTSVPTTPPKVDVSAQIKAVITRVVQDVGAGLRDCTTETAPLPTGRYAVAAVCGLSSDFMQDFGAKQAAFALHKALWTSGLPVGAVEVAIMSSVGAGPLVRARAGYTLMHTQSWETVGPSVWVSFLQQFTRVGGDEDTVYYEHNP